MNSFTQLIQHVKQANWSGANQVFADIMQQKTADRLATERAQIFKGTKVPGKLTEEAVAMKCLECDKTFKSSNTSDPKCPKCGGSDIDID